MKKIALTSLLAVVATGAAHASINVIDGNPLYMPQKGHFYSETSLSSDTNNVDEWVLGEKFGYGINDRVAISVKTSFSEAYWFKGLKAVDLDSREYDGNGNAWNELGADVTWRVVGDKAWKLDLMGGFEMTPVWGDHVPFMDKDTTLYAWNVGVRGGYVNNDWTLSAHANFMYVNTEAFNWGDDDAKFVVWGEDAEFWMNHVLNIGVAGHWTMSDTWSAYASADYYKIMDHYNDPDNKGFWDLTLGLNMNIDTTKYVGAYLTKKVTREEDGKMNVDDANGYGFGVKFGIDF